MHAKTTGQLFTFVMCLLIASQTLAQRPPRKKIHYSTTTEITPFFGAQFLGRMAVQQGNLVLKESSNFGAIIDVPVNYDVYVEFSYSRQPTTLQFEDYRPGMPRTTYDLFNVNVDYWQIGALKEVRYPTYTFFGSVTVGGAGFTPQDPDYNAEWLFSLAGGLGAKYYFSEKLGLRFSGRILLPMKFGGGGMWCGTNGCSVGIGTSSAILQFDASVGILFKIGPPFDKRKKRAR